MGHLVIYYILKRMVLDALIFIPFNEIKSTKTVYKDELKWSTTERHKNKINQT